MSRPLKKKKPEPSPPAGGEYREVEASLPGVLDDDDFSETDYQSVETNPFKELENLISSKNIDVKTFLTERQVVHMHKLGTLYDLYRAAGMTDAATLIKGFADRFMTLIINKGGLSRSQFIEAIGRGRERAEEEQRRREAERLGLGRTI